MAAAKGTRPPNAGKGRKKGSQNKVTRVFRQGVLDAFEAMGGTDALTKWGKENQTEFYKIAARLIPTEVVGPGADGAHLMATKVVHVHRD